MSEGADYAVHNFAFWDRVLIGDDCWLWQGSINRYGYGRFTRRGREIKAHRYAFEEWYGTPIPDGMTVDHVCHNGTTCNDGDACVHRRCCRPDHLEVVTSGENTRRSANTRPGRNIRVVACPQGHPYDEANTYWTAKGRHCKACRVEHVRRWRARQRAAA